MEKQTKNWWVLEYSDKAMTTESIGYPIDEKGRKIFYGTLDEAFDFIQMKRLQIFNFNLRNENIIYFNCKGGNLTFCLSNSPIYFWTRIFKFDATCLKSDGTYDLDNRALLIEKIDEHIHAMRNG